MANNDMLSSLKGMLGDNADEKINAVMNMLKGTQNTNNSTSTDSAVDNSINISDDKKPLPISLGENAGNVFSPEGLEYISKIKGLIDELGSSNDQRSNLLLSLRPYMRGTRQKGIDNAIKILNLSRFSGIFKS